MVASSVGHDGTRYVLDYGEEVKKQVSHPYTDWFAMFGNAKADLIHFLGEEKKELESANKG